MRISRPEDIGALIKSRRLALRWDQQELADRLGTNRRWVWSIESGKPNVRLALVLRALSELDIQLIASDATMMERAEHALEDERQRRALIDIDDIADMGLENIKPKRTGPEK